MRSRFRHCRILAYICTLTAVLACGGGGGGSADGGTTFARVEGRVTRVVAPISARTSTVAPVEVDGIRVEARSTGQVLARDTTDVAGNFALEFVGPGSIDLVFLTDDFSLELGVAALPGSVVRIAVELRPVQDEVIVVDPDDDFSTPLRCETGSLAVVDDDRDLVVDGRGGDCLRVTGNCDVEVVARSITLTNCDACIRAEGTSRTIAVATDGPFICEAAREGVGSAGNARVEIGAIDDDLFVSSGEYGIRAQGNSRVVISADETCSIGAFEALRIDGNATIDTAACDDLQLLGD